MMVSEINVSECSYMPHKTIKSQDLSDSGSLFYLGPPRTKKEQEKEGAEKG